MAEEADVPGRWRASSGEPVKDKDLERLGHGGFLYPAPSRPDLEDEDLDESDEDLGEGKKKNTLWGNIRARRAAGKPRLKPGQKGYPKTLDVESQIVQGHEPSSPLYQMNHQGDGDNYDQMGNQKKK